MSCREESESTEGARSWSGEQLEVGKSSEDKRREEMEFKCWWIFSLKNSCREIQVSWGCFCWRRFVQNNSQRWIEKLSPVIVHFFMLHFFLFNSETSFGNLLLSWTGVQW